MTLPRRLGRRIMEFDALRLKSWLGGSTVPDPMITRNIVPEAPDTYDIGTSLLLYRAIWASELNAIIFAQNVVSLIGGWLLITKGEGAVDEDVNTTETEIDFGSGAGIQANDFLLFRNAGAVEYMQATSVVGGNVWNVTRNLDGSGANAWPLGTPYANLGYNGDGRIELNAYDTPRVQLIKQGTSYNVQTEMMRFGDLNGNWGYGAEQYGIALGEYTNNEANITIESTNGIRLREHNVTKIHIQPDGDIFIGSNIGSPSTTHLAIFTNAQTYNTEAVGAGDMLIGDNSAGHANIFWDTSAGKLKFRGGQTMQCEIGTDGVLLAGAGVVELNSNGVEVIATTVYNDVRSYKLVDASDNVVIQFRGIKDAPGPNANIGGQLFTPGAVGYDSWAGCRADAAGGGDEARTYLLSVIGVNEVRIEAVCKGAADAEQYGYCSDDFLVGKGLYVGSTLSNPAPGTITATDYIVAIGGLKVGAAEDPGANNLKVDGNIVVGGTVDTVDVAALKSAYDTHAADTTDPHGSTMSISSKLYINDSANGKMTTGITINQGTADNEILAMKSSEVAHAMTTYAETDTYGRFQKHHASAGGASFAGFSEDTIGVGIVGMGVNDDTAKSTAAEGFIELEVGKRSGGGPGGVSAGANANLVAIVNWGTTRFVFDSEGEMHSDDVIGEGEDWDSWDDLALAADLSRLPKAKFHEMLRYRAADFERAGLLTLSVDEYGVRHAFIRHKAMLQFTMCCFAEVAQRLNRAEERAAIYARELDLLKGEMRNAVG